MFVQHWGDFNFNNHKHLGVAATAGVPFYRLPFFVEQTKQPLSGCRSHFIFILRGYHWKKIVLTEQPAVLLDPEGSFALYGSYF